MTLHFIAQVPASVIVKVMGHQRRWLAGGYDLEWDILRGG